MSCRKAEKGWWPERESNPRHEDFQWRVAKFPKHFQLVAKIKTRCATEYATEPCNGSPNLDDPRDCQLYPSQKLRVLIIAKQ